MIAVPIGPRQQRFACVAAPTYWDRRGRPNTRAICWTMTVCEGGSPAERFRRGVRARREVVMVDPKGPLVFSVNGAADLAIDTAAAGGGVIFLFEDWLKPLIDSGMLEPVLVDWHQPFSGPFLYYSGRRLTPPPLRAFVDYVRANTTD